MLGHYGPVRRTTGRPGDPGRTDFNPGSKGIGPKSLKLIQQFGRLEHLPDDIRMRLEPDPDPVRRIFLAPEVTSDYRLEGGLRRTPGLIEFLSASASSIPNASGVRSRACSDAPPAAIRAECLRSEPPR